MKITKIFGMAIGAMILGAVPAMAQNSFPAPGSGGGYNPAPPQNSLPAPGAGGGFRPAPGGPGMIAPPPAGNPGWGGYGPSVGLNISFGSPVAQDQGYETVMACGYDAQGIWRVLPLYVSYDWNGCQYNVTVVNAWNPWTQMWNRNVDMPAYNTSYYLRGNNYNFYAPLSTGTYYFNL